MSNYQQGKNWTAANGNFYNGNGEAIRNPTQYFDAVASNTNGYNAGYSNGHGKAIEGNPTAYFRAVSSDKVMR